MGRRLASAINPNGDNIAYTYNADGLLTSKKKGSIEYYYYWNGDKLTAQTDNGNTWYFRYDGDTPIGLEFDGVEYYYVTNLQGDVIAILNDSGECVAEYSYDAWGNCTVTKATDTIAYDNPLRYRGYYYDFDSGLYYLQSRFYDANTGRFINADEPEMILQGVYNLFSYCENNPVNCVDYAGYSTGYVKDRELRNGMGLSSFWTRAKSIYTPSSCLNKIAKYHDWIMKCAQGFKIPGEMIMAVLYREMTCYGVDDQIADASVMRHYMIGKWTGWKSDSSTGLAQITATTAISAEKYLGYNSTRNTWTMWQYLQNEKTNIFYCGMVLRYEAEKLGLKYGIYRKNYDFIQKVFTKYNGGSGYGKEVIKIYKQFLKY